MTLAELMDKVGVGNYPSWFPNIRLKFPPMPHQLEMMKLYATKTRFMDAGEPGVGKTYPAQAHGILMAALGNKVVYTMPPKLIDQFVEEIEDFFRPIRDYLKIGKLYGTAAQKRKLVEQWNVEGWPELLFVSYDGYREWNDIQTAKKIGKNQWYSEDGSKWDEEEGGPAFTRDGRPIDRRGMADNDKHRLLTKKGYNVFFFDEAHALCGVGSIISDAVAEVASENSAIYLMTGTPVPTNISHAYGIIRVINPEAYPNEYSFQRQHVVTQAIRITGANNRTRRVRVPVDYINTEKIHTELFKNARRLQKREVNKLPDPIITDVKLRLEGKHKRLYDSLIKNHFAMVGETILAPESQSSVRHLSLQLISCPTEFDPNISMKNELFDRTKELVESINPWQNKIIIFAYYRAAIEFLAEEFKEYNPAVVYGGVTNSTEEINRFKHDDDCRMIILNWVSGGAGLNLQVASHGIFYECPTSPKDAKQAIARMDRTGQHNVVNIYFMRVMGTLSDKNFKKLLQAEETNNEVVKDELDLIHKIVRGK